MDFGEKIKELREAKGMTQQNLADLLFVTRQTVSRWEGGSRYPDLVTAKNLADILDTTVDTLMADDASMLIEQPRQSVLFMLVAQGLRCRRSVHRRSLVLPVSFDNRHSVQCILCTHADIVHDKDYKEGTPDREDRYPWRHFLYIQGPC